VSVLQPGYEGMLAGEGMTATGLAAQIGQTEQTTSPAATAEGQR
jgi:hypothetical protein